MMTRGRTPAAFRRAVQDGHGWYGFGLDVEQTAHDIEALQMEQRYQRPAELGRLEVSVTPAMTSTPLLSSATPPLARIA